jgi:uncharacterized protein
MKALIISDSHGFQKELVQIKERHQDEVDVMIHCGDSELPANAEEIKDFITVEGNCDRLGFPEHMNYELGNKKFFIAHGHQFNVKQSLLGLKYKNDEIGAHIICFGHSHVPIAEKDGDVLFINPGSIKSPRFITYGTYVIYHFDEENEQVDFYDIHGNHCPQLSKIFK